MVAARPDGAEGVPEGVGGGAFLVVTDVLALWLPAGLAVELAEVAEVVELGFCWPLGLAGLPAPPTLATVLEAEVLEAEVLEAAAVDELGWVLEAPQPARTTVTNRAAARAERQGTPVP